MKNYEIIAILSKGSNDAKQNGLINFWQVRFLSSFRNTNFFYSSFNNIFIIVQADLVTDEPGPKIAETPALYK